MMKLEKYEQISGFLDSFMQHSSTVCCSVSSDCTYIYTCLYWSVMYLCTFSIYIRDSGQHSSPSVYLQLNKLISSGKLSTSMPYKVTIPHPNTHSYWSTQSGITYCISPVFSVAKMVPFNLNSHYTLLEKRQFPCVVFIMIKQFWILHAIRTTYIFIFI